MKKQNLAASHKQLSTMSKINNNENEIPARSPFVTVQDLKSQLMSVLQERDILKRTLIEREETLANMFSYIEGSLSK